MREGAPVTAEPAVRTRRRWLLLLAGVAVAALALLGWALEQRADPRDLVVDYVDAVAAGDVERANALAPDGVETTGELPAPGSMDDADPITAVQVADDGRDTHVSPLTGEDFDAVGFEVSYEVAGQRVSDPVFVERTGGSWLHPEWRIRQSLAQPVRVLLTPPLTEVDVVVGSGTTTAVAPAATPAATELPLYPGAYRLQPRTGAADVLDPVELSVTDESTPVVLEATPGRLREATGPQLLDTVTTALTECLAAAVDYASCDGGLTLLLDFPTPDGATWRVDGDVVLADERYGQGWPATATVVATWTDDTGTARQQRFVVTGGAVVTSVSVDRVDVVGLWSRVERD